MPTISTSQSAAAMAGPRLSLGVHINSGASVTDLYSVLHTSHCSLDHTQASSGCLCSQPQSSPQVCLLKPRFSAPVPTHSSRYVFWAAECSKVARTKCVGLSLSLSCLLQANCCTGKACENRTKEGPRTGVRTSGGTKSTPD